jgi:hypothetical protein
VTVHNVQTDRGAPLQPAYGYIFADQPGPCSVQGEVNCPPISLYSPYGYDLSGSYFDPGQTIQIPYEGGPVPDTMNPSTFTWSFFIQNEPSSLNSSVQLDVPSS